MALLVHLPLLGNLNNQGLAELSSITLVSDNSFVTGGKIGSQSLAITKQQPILSTSSCMSNKKQMSYAFWIKVNNAWEADWLDGIRWVSTDGSATHVSRQEFYSNCTRVGTWFKGGALSGYSFVVGEWTHLAGTYDYDTGVACFYINGVLQGTKSTLDTTHYCRGDFYIGDNNVDITLSDVRIYDHALSSMEVKHLSQGLVLHYPLDGNNGTLANPNLLTKATSEFSNWTNINPNCVTVTSDNYKNVFLLTQGLDGKWENVYSPAITVEANKEYTISCLYKVYDDYNYTTSYGDFGLTVMKAVPTNANPISNTIARASFKNITGGFWKAQATFTPTVSTIYLNMCGGSIVDGQTNKKFDVYYLKLEEGDKATPWCPNPSDALYTALGYDDGIEYDTSGYGNNGTKVGTLSYSTDSPRYLASTYMPESSLITHPNPLGGTATEQEWTCAMWVKLDTTNTNQYMNNFNNGNIIIAATTPLLYLNSGTNDYYMYGSQAIEAGIWTHIAFVFRNKDGMRNVYINGILKNNYGPNKTSTPSGIPNTVNMGGRLAGYISDYRIYATALSDSEIQKLYTVSASIDSNGNAYSAAYVEG